MLNIEFSVNATKKYSVTSASCFDIQLCVGRKAEMHRLPMRSAFAYGEGNRVQCDLVSVE